MNRRSLSSLILLSFFAACGSGGDASGNDASIDEDAAVSECAVESDGTPCGLGRICLGGSCETSICGDGFVDSLRSEECDDGNFTDGDGCDNDCSYSCHEDADCDDENVCTGIEACIEVPNGKACQLGTPLECDEGDMCKVYTCDPVDGCGVEDLVMCYRDQDADGFPLLSDSTPANECICPVGYISQRGDSLWDCNDRDADVRPNQTAWFAVPHCANGAKGAPSGVAYLCSVDPVRYCTGYACADGSTPSWDYNCDDVGTRRWTNVNAGACDVLCSGSGWTGSWAPPCGTSAEHRLCSRQFVDIGFVCNTSVAIRTQECR